MKKEEKLFSVQCRLNDQDFEDVFRLYQEMEHGFEKKVAMIICAALCTICVVLMILMHNITFLFYGIGCIVVGLAYLLVPVNRKFIATNRLMFGMNREIGFYPHMITTMEIFEDEDAADMTEEEIEEATTVISTGSINTYENERGFLFAEGKITNQFFYLPKRNLTETEIGAVRAFAEENCAGEFRQVEMKSMIAPDETEDAQQETEEAPSDFVESVCKQYYGGGKLHLHDDEGHPVETDEEDGEDASGELTDAEASEEADAEQSPAEAETEQEAEPEDTDE